MKSAPAVKPSKVDALARSDGWANVAAGFGTSRDKMQAGVFLEDAPLDAQILSAMYYGDDMSATIVDAILKEAFRRGYCLEAEDSDPTAVEALEEHAGKLDLDAKLKQAATWGRLFGGCLLIMGADDGQALSEPLNEKRIKTVSYLLLVDARQAQPETYCTELGPRLGDAETYRCTVPAGNTTISLTVHHSRCIRFGGTDVDAERRRRLRGWDQSVLQRPYDVLRSFGHAMQGVSTMLADASQGVFTIKGLMQMLASNQRKPLQERMQMLDYGRSTTRSIVLDEGETFTKVGSNFGGIPEMLDRLYQRVSAAADMPVSILFGRSAAGMNATGDLDLESWRVEVASYAADVLAPRIARAYQILSLAKDAPTRGNPLPGLEVEWHPLTLQTEKEKAEVYKIKAEADATLVSAGIYDPLEIAISRAGDDMSPKVDVAELEAELDQRATFDPPASEAPALPPPAAAPPVAQAPAAAPLEAPQDAPEA